MTNTNIPKLDLGCIKRLTDELSTELAKTSTGRPPARAHNTFAGGIQKKHGSQFELENQYRLAWLFSCLASLSKRQIIPSNLAGSFIQLAINKIAIEVFGSNSLKVDDCQLARAAGLFIEKLASGIEPNDFEEATSRTIKCLRHWIGKTNALSDPLFSGWVYQYLIHRCDKQMKKGALLSGHTPFYTKWFTPSWIANFLVEDSISAANQTFIDPACGAGHILVPALEKTVKLLTQEGLSSPNAVHSAIEKLLFGLEIDEQLSASANFSLYLACRDIDANVALPAANIFTADAPGGSLQLSQGGVPQELFLMPVASKSRIPASKLPKKFEALAANPPYMSMRNMPEDLSQFLKENFPLSKYDLYTAFIELSLNLLEQNARASLIVQQSVLSISRFKPLRDFIEQQSAVETVVQLGSGSFPTRAGEKVNNAIITFRKRSRAGNSGSNAKIHFARILYPEEKKQAELYGIRSVLEIRDFDKASLSSKKQMSIAPWCPPSIVALFDKYPPLQDSQSGIVVVNGLFTCNNKMFVRRFDEVAEDERHEYVPYDKGGGQKWFHSTPYLLHWQNEGNVIREYRASRGQSRSLPGEDFYFKPGITYSYIGTQGFKARLLSPESIFDIASSSVFTPESLRMYMLGFMNSSLVRYLMGVLNPTINFQIGDLRRLPFAQPDSLTQYEVSKLADEAVDLARRVETMEGNLADQEYIIWARSKEIIIQSEIDRLIFALYKIPAKLQKQILEDPWVVRGQKNVFSANAHKKG